MDKEMKPWEKTLRKKQQQDPLFKLGYRKGRDSIKNAHERLLAAIRLANPPLKSLLNFVEAVKDVDEKIFSEESYPNGEYMVQVGLTVHQCRMIGKFAQDLKEAMGK